MNSLIEIRNLSTQVAGCLGMTFRQGYKWAVNRQDDLAYPVLFLEIPHRVNWGRTRTEIHFNWQIVTNAKQWTAHTAREENQFEALAYTWELTQSALSILEWWNLNRLKKENWHWDLSLPLYEAYEDSVFGWRTNLIYYSDGLQTCNLPTDGFPECLEAGC